MLERSQTAPLDVHFTSLDFKHSTKTLTTIFHEIERVRTLTFILRERHFLDMVHDAFASLGRDWEAYLLESLTIGMNTVSRPAIDAKLAMDLFRPTRLLRRLTLLGGYYDWNMLPLPNLTHLELYGQSLGGVSPVHFIETLRQMQHLEVLGIGWKNVCLHHFPPIPRPQPIHLPSLQRLNISDGYSVHVESFLVLVTHPKLHQLSMSISTPVTEVLALAQAVLSSVGQGDFSPFESLKMYFNGNITITIFAKPWSSYDDGSLIHMFIPIDEEGFDVHDDRTNFGFLVDIIMSCLTPLVCPDKIPLRHLHLGGWDLPIDEFTRLFASLPHLETIELDEKLALILFKVLNIASASDSSIIPFPKLRSIIWNGEWQHIREVPVLSPSVFDDLYSGLLSRHAHGTGITELRLVGCEHLNEIQVRQLEEIGIRCMTYMTSTYGTIL
ncbi:hypothetical protein D9619_009866 [Psilocybe cf. subviscida]|uniref:F-box domain-containing protein n=1 Tax=Psilocybe cf. subviscida TaxID=2480587 RepID=A0A8H5BLD1_9AGAR|nr:hypothetical protein D9619_009866 [Psilocybe cf. subviscida]